MTHRKNRELEQENARLLEQISDGAQKAADLMLESDAEIERLRAEVERLRADATDSDQELEEWSTKYALAEVRAQATESRLAAATAWVEKWRNEENHQDSGDWYMVQVDRALAAQPAAPSLGHPGADDVFARLARWHTELVEGRSGHSAYHVQSAAPARTVERLPPRTIPEDQLAPVACTEAEQRVLDACASAEFTTYDGRECICDDDFAIGDAELARREASK